MGGTVIWVVETMDCRDGGGEGVGRCMGRLNGRWVGCMQWHI